jgi:hypothetical protein
VAGPPGRWDVGHWDAGDTWVGPVTPPGAGWGNEWRFWYQLGTAQVVDLTSMVVEARWTTDGHTPGDGTYRGDVQPGKCTVRFWDPQRTLGGLDKYGALWACYLPTGATWAWFYNTLTRGLYAPGDPAAADCVFAGDTWPLRMTTDTFTSYFDANNRPAESSAARLGNLADQAVATTGWHLPAIAKVIAAQSQLVPATTITTGGPPPSWPSWLSLVRDAATDGLMWWAYGRDGNGNGIMTFRYDRWETANAQRVLDPAQVVAGPPVDASASFVFGFVDMNATRGNDAYKTYVREASNMAFAGAGNIAVRLYGDIENTSGTGGRQGPDYNAASATMSGWAADHSDPTERILSSVSCQSGDRHTTSGQASTAWDPAAHVWSPLDVLAYADPVDSKTHLYRVAKSAHVLTAATWQTVHTLEKYSPGFALP